MITWCDLLHNNIKVELIDNISFSTVKYLVLYRKKVKSFLVTRKRDRVLWCFTNLKCLWQHTLLTKAKQRWRLISLRRSFGRLWTKISSSTPRVANHLYWSYRLTRSLSSFGSKRWCIHCSESRLLTLISSSLRVRDWRYVCNNGNTETSVTFIIYKQSAISYFKEKHHSDQA